jgi:hypothetical protein
MMEHIMVGGCWSVWCVTYKVYGIKIPKSGYKHFCMVEFFVSYPPKLG